MSEASATPTLRVGTTEYEPVIGLEVHVQLATDSKLFCGCSTVFGAQPNTNICPVCTGQPGVLPVLNKSAVDCAIKMALALSCEVNLESRFARKNYFYPDLPKGYQITQFEEPIAEHGVMEIWEAGELKRIGVTRIHLEDDAGKNIHLPRGNVSLVDLNRAGVALIEIVSEPELRTPSEAAEYMRGMRAIVRAIGVSDGNLDEGSLRCDANISVRPVGQSRFGTKTEMKNLNSFRHVQKALDYEISRQIAVLNEGGSIIQETRLFDAERAVTVSMRSKEEAHDYRYFPEPDLPPLTLRPERVSALRAQIPELPLQRRLRLMRDHQLSEYDATEVTREVELGQYFDQVVAAGVDAKRAANWLLTELLSKVSDARDVATAAVPPSGVAKLLALVESGRLSTKLAKEIWPVMWESGRDAEEIATEQDLFQQNDEASIEANIAAVLAQAPEKVADYRAGREKLFGWFVGQVMKATRGKANPGLVNDVLRRQLRQD